MTIPVCYVLFVILFLTGTIKGGADVKCLMSIAIMFPVYPLFGDPLIAVPLMISKIISFPIAVLFHAAVLSMLLVIPMAARNIMRGDTKFPKLFTGYRMDATKAQNSHVWTMDENEVADDGRIWVTPKIPFIVPITAAAIFLVFAGNVLFLL
jgi:preflagellin peptidase FlaK